jgi:hypothetical protein
MISFDWLACPRKRAFAVIVEGLALYLGLGCAKVE